MDSILVLSRAVPQDLQLELLKTPVTISAQEIAQLDRWTEAVEHILSYNAIQFDPVAQDRLILAQLLLETAAIGQVMKYDMMIENYIKLNRWKRYMGWMSFVKRVAIGMAVGFVLILAMVQLAYVYFICPACENSMIIPSGTTPWLSEALKKHPFGLTKEDMQQENIQRDIEQIGMINNMNEKGPELVDEILFQSRLDLCLCTIAINSTIAYSHFFELVMIIAAAIYLF